MNGTIQDCPKPTQFVFEKLKDVHLLEMPIKINILLNAVLAVTATLGNGMIIVAILRSQNLQTPSYLLITSLAFADLLVGLVYHPLQIVVNSYYLQGNIREICALSSTYSFFTTYFSSMPMVMVTCISIDRYLALTLRHRYTIIVTKKRVRLLIVFWWIAASLLSLSLIIDKLFETVIIIHSSLSLLMLSTTCVCYIKSFRALRLYSVQVHAQQHNPLAGNFDVVRYRKTLKTMLIVLTCFLLCYIPIVCVFPLMGITGSRAESIVLYFASLTIMGFNSSINPVFYIVRFTDLRIACKEILRNLIQ